MNLTRFFTCTTYFIPPTIATVGSLFLGTAVLAQQMEEITVVAPHQVHRKTVGRSTIGAPIEEISLSQPVSYGDLNLSKPEDQAALKARIADMAKEGCDELDELFPFDKDRDKNRDCVKDAIAQAQAQVVAAIQSPRPQ